MSNQKLLNYYPLLEILKNFSKKNNTEQFKKIISYLDDKSLKFLAECIRNILSHSVFETLPKSKQSKLLKVTKPDKKNIKKLLSPKAKASKKKKILQQGGAWFLPLLSAIIPLFASLIKPPQPAQ